MVEVSESVLCVVLRCTFVLLPRERGTSMNV